MALSAAPGVPSGRQAPNQRLGSHTGPPGIAFLERQLRDRLLAGSGDAIANAALTLADGLSHTPRATERPALLRLAAMRGGPGASGRALLRLGAALAQRGADSEARIAWSAAARHADPAEAAAAELELALADLAAGRGHRARRSLSRLATDQRDPDVTVIAGFARPSQGEAASASSRPRQAITLAP